MSRLVNAVACSIGCLVLALSASSSLAAEVVDHAAVLSPFVNDDTFAVVLVDVAALETPEKPGELVKRLPIPSAEMQSWAAGLTLLDGFVRQLQQAGGKNAYLIAGLADANLRGGPLLVATVRSGQSPEKTDQLFRGLIRELQNGPDKDDAQGYVKQLEVQQKGEVVLVGTKPTIARYAALQPAARADLIEPLTKLSVEGAIAAAVFCPGPDFRRVVRELWPTLPGTLAPLRGELIDRWVHLEAAVNAPPDIRPQLALLARDPESAQLAAKLWGDLPTATTEFGGNPQTRAMAKGFAQVFVNAFPAKVEGTRVAINFPADQATWNNLRTMFSEASAAAAEPAGRMQRMNNFKQILVAMHVYNDTHRHLPPAAICDQNGKPLLSWRVAILPFIDQNALYKEFHLDEPWDSPHNRTLIEKMPDLYADPDPMPKQLARQGKTVYQVPVGPDTVFHDSEGTMLGQISDGASNTVAIVEVEPHRAVVWTKPQDWSVDLDHPLSGVERSDRDFFVAGYLDGHIEAVPAKIDEKVFRASLTRAGREHGRQP